ncbi:MAG: type I secretion system permease/ATPase, partial [Microcystaceae cyanobacterium]
FPEAEIPYADATLLGTPVKPRQAQQARKSYPVVRGNSPSSSAVACFQMISQYFGMPFRKEIIQRVVNEELLRNPADVLSLPTCGAITELMGLNSQLVRIPSHSFTQLNVPVLTRWQNRLVVV